MLLFHKNSSIPSIYAKEIIVIAAKLIKLKERLKKNLLVRNKEIDKLVKKVSQHEQLLI